MKTIKVVAAIIVRNDEIFITQRGYGEFKDWWEFPGGKVEQGESKEDALKREIKEELDASIEIDRFLTTVEYQYDTFYLVMDCYICHLVNPHLELLEHENAIWVHKDELESVDFLPADVAVVKELLKQF